jgi:hypothetical protein
MIAEARNKSDPPVRPRKLPEGAKVNEATDAALLELQTVSMAFGRFAAYFVWKHTS